MALGGGRREAIVGNIRNFPKWGNTHYFTKSLRYTITVNYLLANNRKERTVLTAVTLQPRCLTTALLHIVLQRVS